MPCLNKEAISHHMSSNCRRQLFLYLYPERQEFAAERAAHGIPRTQAPRPGLEQFAQEGERWQREKTADLARVFGHTSLVGLRNPTTNDYGRCQLSEVLNGAVAGQFIVEGEFVPPPGFLNVFGMEGFQDSRGFNLTVSAFRPDLISVNQPGTCDLRVEANGNISNCGSDERLQLQIVDIKLTSEPSPGYFAETVLYTMALAAWIEYHELADRFVVTANPAIWPGSHEASNLARAEMQDVRPPASELSWALRSDWVLTPYEVFATRLHQMISADIRRVLGAPNWLQLEWHVDNRCRACEYLGYDWTSSDPESLRNPDPAHCMQQAARENHLSCIAFISRGGAGSLRQSQITSIQDVAALPSDHVSFDAHHGLRQTRHILANRAQSLVTSAVMPLPSLASMATLPAFASRKVYITVDFESSQALTFAIGIMAINPPTGVRGMEYNGVFGRKYYVIPTPSPDAERLHFLQFLRDLQEVVSAPAQDRTYQIYVWDELQYRHLCDLIGRHLAAILADTSIAHLAWLFPPEELLGNPNIQGAASPVTILKSAVRSLVAVPVPHFYNLLRTAREYHHQSLDARWARFHVHPLFEDALSDMIPSERAHDIWAGTTDFAMTVNRLIETINTRLRALHTVERRLVEDLQGRLTCQAPEYSDPSPRAILQGSISVDGRFWYLHAKLNSALDDLEKRNIRALLPAEREARYHSAVLVRRLEADEKVSALTIYGLPDSPFRLVYEVATSSLNSKVRDGDINFAISPMSMVAFLDRRVLQIARGSTLEALYREGAQLRVKMSELCGVTVRRFDAERRLAVVDLDTFGNRGRHVLQLESEGVFDLSRQVILDPIHKEFFLKKLKACVEAIGNPPNAPDDAEVRIAIHLRRNARRTSTVAPSLFLWDGHARSQEPFLPDVSVLRTLVAPYVALNDSQWRAWEHSLGSRCRLIWGPPGTGKSHTIRAIVFGAMLQASMRGERMRVCVCGNTYTAVDNVLQGLPTLFEPVEGLGNGRVFRIRSSTKEPYLEPNICDVAVAENTIGGLRPRLTRDCNEQTVVGGTPQQLNKLANLLTSQSIADLFDLLIIDEASQMSVAQSILPICTLASDGALIVAGDPKQLAPISSAEPPLGLEAMVGAVYSYFKERFRIPEESLETNYRSNREIVAVAHVAGYDSHLTSNSPELRLEIIGGVPTGQPSDWPDYLPWSDTLITLLQPTLPVAAFVYSEGASAQQNAFEAQIVASFCRLAAGRLASQPRGEQRDGIVIPAGTEAYSDEAFWTSGIGIVTPHRAQQALITSLLQRAFPETPPSLIRGAVDTVERYQGQQRDVMLISYAVGDPDSIAEEEEFLMSLNRFNVSVSRARCKVVTFLTRELLDHIPAEMRLIQSSAFIKGFAQRYCSEYREVNLNWIGPLGNTSSMTGQLRFPHRT